MDSGNENVKLVPRSIPCLTRRLAEIPLPLLSLLGGEKRKESGSQGENRREAGEERAVSGSPSLAGTGRN